MSMKKIITMTLLIFILSCLLVVGYAAINDAMFVSGEVNVEAKPFVGVYIAAAEIYSQNNANSISLNYIMPTNLYSSVNPLGNQTSITYKLTLHNNSNVTYWYIKPEYVKDLESNSLIGASNGITITTKDHPSDTYSTFDSNDWIPPNTYRDVYVTYSFGSNAQTYPTTLVNYLFGVKMDSVHDKFLTVLNDVTSTGTYDVLSDAFDEKYQKTGSTILSNIGEEKKIFDQLFGSSLTITVDGVQVPVTVMVERSNVDGRTTGDSYSASGGPTGCEYTVYITVDPLDSPSGKAIVYAVSYSKGGTAGSDEWYQLGELYEGTANRIDYDTSTSKVDGAFDISSWIASPNQYTVANGITYLVGQEQGDQYDKLKTIKDLMSTNDQDIFNDIDNKHILKDVYAIVYNSQNYTKPGYQNLRDAFSAASPFYNVMNNGQEVKVKRNCTRAEIVPYIEKIQAALDYYNQVN